MELLVPAAGMSLTQFHDHWHHPHAAMARRLGEIRQYAQNHCVRSDVLEHDSIFEGIAEGWLDSVEHCSALMNHPFFQDQVIRDEEQLLDQSRMQIILVCEHFVSEGPADGAAWRQPTETSECDLKWSEEFSTLAVKLFAFIAPGGDADVRSNEALTYGFRIGGAKMSRVTRPFRNPQNTVPAAFPHRLAQQKPCDKPCKWFCAALKRLNN